jgi:hypothetical protein
LSSNAVTSLCAKSGRLPHDVNGAAFAALVPDVAHGEATDAEMDPFIDETVRRSIRHARLMLRQGSYDWPIARRALRKILADLEAKSPNHPSLPRLRAFIAANDRAWLRKNR